MKFKTIVIMPIQIILVICIALMTTNCGNLNAPSEMNTMVQELGKPTVIIPNPDKTLDLYLWNREKIGDPAKNFEYAVFNHIDSTKIMNDHFRGEDILWNGVTSLKLIHYVGIIQAPKDLNPETNTTTQNNYTIIELKKTK